MPWCMCRGQRHFCEMTSLFLPRGFLAQSLVIRTLGGYPDSSLNCHISLRLEPPCRRVGEWADGCQLAMMQAEAVPSSVSSDRRTDDGQEDLFRQQLLSAQQFLSSYLSHYGKKVVNERGESRALGLKEKSQESWAGLREAHWSLSCK